MTRRYHVYSTYLLGLSTTTAPSSRRGEGPRHLINLLRHSFAHPLTAFSSSVELRPGVRLQQTFHIAPREASPSPFSSCVARGVPIFFLFFEAERDAYWGRGGRDESVSTVQQQQQQQQQQQTTTNHTAFDDDDRRSSAPRRTTDRQTGHLQ